MNFTFFVSSISFSLACDSFQGIKNRQPHIRLPAIAIIVNAINQNLSDHHAVSSHTPWKLNIRYIQRRYILQIVGDAVILQFFQKSIDDHRT